PLIRFLLQFEAYTFKHTDSLKIYSYQYLLLEEAAKALSATALREIGGKALKGRMQKLMSLRQDETAPVPLNLKTTLRDYQYQGLNWLQLLRTCQLGGILADDMGLGKTIQTLAHLLLEKEQGRSEKASLIVTPTSIASNWFAEAKRFAPAL